MAYYPVKHLKLSTGEELVCRVVEDSDYEIVIADALKIVSSTKGEYKFYTFKAFMVYQDRRENVVILRADKIVSYANPPQDLIGEYNMALDNMFEWTDKTGEEQRRIAEVHWKGESGDIEYGKDSGSNVLQFPDLIPPDDDGGTVHQLGIQPSPNDIKDYIIQNKFCQAVF